MCGRFYIDEKTVQDITDILHGIDEKLRYQIIGDKYPSDSSLLIIGKNNTLSGENMHWGFPNSMTKQLIINARSETVLEKKSFSDSVLKRRCIIPAAHFYEWDSNKNKVTFTLPTSPSIYMAGFYNTFNGQDQFVILTTRANASMKPVHDRMPLILKRDQISDWIFNTDMTRDFLQQESPILTRSQEFEQLSLF